MFVLVLGNHLLRCQERLGFFFVYVLYYLFFCSFKINFAKGNKIILSLQKETSERWFRLHMVKILPGILSAWHKCSCNTAPWSPSFSVTVCQAQIEGYTDQQAGPILLFPQLLINWFMLGETLKILCFQPLCHGRGHLPLDPAAQSPILENFQWSMTLTFGSSLYRLASLCIALTSFLLHWTVIVSS